MILIFFSVVYVVICLICKIISFLIEVGVKWKLIKKIILFLVKKIINLLKCFFLKGIR